MHSRGKKEKVSKKKQDMTLMTLVARADESLGPADSVRAHSSSKPFESGQNSLEPVDATQD